MWKGYNKGQDVFPHKFFENSNNNNGQPTYPAYFAQNSAVKMTQSKHLKDGALDHSQKSFGGVKLADSLVKLLVGDASRNTIRH